MDQRPTPQSSLAAYDYEPARPMRVNDDELKVDQSDGPDKSGLQKRETCCAGTSLLIVAFIWFVCLFSWEKVTTEIEIGLIDDAVEIAEMHSIVSDNRSSLLTIASFLYLALPFAFLHLYYIDRVFQCLFPNIEFLKHCYIYCWIAIMIVACVLHSPSLIVASYFEWDIELESGTNDHTAYYMQYYCLSMFILLGNALAIVCCFVACIPWVLLIQVSWRKTNIEYTDEFRQHILPFKCGHANSSICWIAMFMFLIFILWAALSSMFNLSRHGFYSVDGDSSKLGVVVLISYIFIAFWLFWVTRYTQTLQKAVKKLE